jgi:hypothetical protein
MIFLLLGLGMLVVLLGTARGFSTARIATVKTFLAWVAALGGLALATMLLLTGRGGAAIGALIMFGPLVWSWWQEGAGRKPGARPAGGPRPRAAASGAMTRDEAWQVLGLRPGASVADIRAAHLRLMQAAHPDRGGSDWLAARINQARDLLLGR